MKNPFKSFNRFAPFKRFNADLLTTAVATPRRFNALNGLNDLNGLNGY